ncbi:MAG: AmmeMemoRadiSam system protein A [Oscillospiraceae bacterium]|jgi:AmmeMemoRadiSam system protein A|nr:AmmeMemoRadiSam system protein A [Oscillospiraceae bacterium]
MIKACLMPHPPLLVPGVGRDDEIPDTRRACEAVADEIGCGKPDVLVIISPHGTTYDDYFHIAPGDKASGDFSRFRAGQVSMSVAYDAALAALIGETARAEGIPAGPLGERDPALDHGVLVPLYFLGTDVPIVRISLSGLSPAKHYRLGMCVRKAAEALSRRVAVIASGDMSHKLAPDGPYGFAPEGPEFDEIVCGCIKDADFARLMSIDTKLAGRAAECGLRSLFILAGALDGLNARGRVLCYEGPFGVGYLTAVFDTGESAYARLARETIVSYVKTGKTLPLPADLPEEMLTKRAGVFVSIKKHGDLRGCIGTIAPTAADIASEIIENSVSAATRDPRFRPVTPSELDDLTISVDVLNPPEPISGPEALDVKRYGVIVTAGRKRGLLLPNLDGVDTVEEQIAIAMRKAGIQDGETVKLERFEVIRHL